MFHLISDEDHGEKAVTINLDGIENEIILLDFPSGEISVSISFVIKIQLISFVLSFVLYPGKD